MKTKTKVIVKFEVPGFHRWPEAPEHRQYLASRHRHLFKFVVEAEVGNDDRDVEFHDLREIAADSLTNFEGDKVDGFEFEDFSCERIARHVWGSVAEATAVEVWEDGECGARVEVSE